MAELHIIGSGNGDAAERIAQHSGFEHSLTSSGLSNAMRDPAHEETSCSGNGATQHQQPSETAGAKPADAYHRNIGSVDRATKRESNEERTSSTSRSSSGATDPRLLSQELSGKRRSQQNTKNRAEELDGCMERTKDEHFEGRMNKRLRSTSLALFPEHQYQSNIASTIGIIEANRNVEQLSSTHETAENYLHGKVNRWRKWMFCEQLIYGWGGNFLKAPAQFSSDTFRLAQGTKRNTSNKSKMKDEEIELNHPIYEGNGKALSQWTSDLCEKFERNLKRRTIIIGFSQFIDLLDSVYEQIGEGLFISKAKVDWNKVSTAAEIEAKLCEYIWWNFRLRHYVPRLGCIIMEWDGAEPDQTEAKRHNAENQSFLSSMNLRLQKLLELLKKAELVPESEVANVAVALKTERRHSLSLQSQYPNEQMVEMNAGAVSERNVNMENITEFRRTGETNRCFPQPTVVHPERKGQRQAF